MKNVIITGATGMVGKGVLLECLDHPEIQTVLVIGRSSLQLTHPKLKEILHNDFLDFSSIQDQLIGYDACYYCLGVSAMGLSEEAYAVITYNYTLELARTLYAINPNFSFMYVSGQGTDSSEKGNVMWARVKGRTENAIIGLGFAQSFAFRPGMIEPLRGITSKTRLYQFFISYAGWIFSVVKTVAPNSVTDTTKIGLAMIYATLYGYEKSILLPIDINTRSLPGK